MVTLYLYILLYDRLCLFDCIYDHVACFDQVLCDGVAAGTGTSVIGDLVNIASKRVHGACDVYSRKISG